MKIEPRSSIVTSKITRPLPRAQLLRLAVKALRKYKKELAVDASLREIFGADYPRALFAAREKPRVDQAIQQLNQMLNEKE